MRPTQRVQNYLLSETNRSWNSNISWERFRNRGNSLMLSSGETMSREQGGREQGGREQGGREGAGREGAERNGKYLNNLSVETLSHFHPTMSE